MAAASRNPRRRASLSEITMPVIKIVRKASLLLASGWGGLQPQPSQVPIVLMNRHGRAKSGASLKKSPPLPPSRPAPPLAVRVLRPAGEPKTGIQLEAPFSFVLRVEEISRACSAGSRLFGFSIKSRALSLIP